MNQPDQIDEATSLADEMLVQLPALLRNEDLARYHARISRLMLKEQVKALEQVTCHKHGFGKDSCPQIKERISNLEKEIKELQG